ncbi:DUF11 domain-containing protein [Dokdonella sp.]|uniref:DUF11 domain-containing protein n=1 Tax=Dokdonella sp. TaxID=2291710 RepID=UPI00352789BB
MDSRFACLFLSLAAATAGAAEVTVQNDSLTDFSTGIVQAGFVANEKGASWLTSPCTGNIVAAQIFWRSLSGNTGKLLGGSIDIHRAGTYPEPGVLAEQIAGPVLTDGVLNEYRYLDDNSTIPLSVPVVTNETVVVAYRFAEAPTASGPSLVNDTNGIQAGRNAIYANLGGGIFVWASSETFGVSGDWVIRAVVDCQSSGSEADVSATITTTPDLYTPGAALSHSMTIANIGPADAPSVIVFDAFPATYTGVTWSCAASAGANCTSGGSGNISQSVSLPAGSQVAYTVNATIVANAMGVLSNTVTAVVNAPNTDPDSSNNAATANTAPLSDRIFASGFESQP